MNPLFLYSARMLCMIYNPCTRVYYQLYDMITLDF